MASTEGESLESLLNKATNPALRDEDWAAIMAFCDRVNKELEGPQISVRLLAHKIQSPQEREALFALMTLESCVKNCGQRFHQEIGKFRFLNEMIKVVSPKYLGAHTAEKVKTKCIEMMYSWSIGLKHEQKITEAYSMLKRQGIVTEDPTYVDKTWVPPEVKNKRADFEDEEKSKQLARLLKSKNPEDLQAANRLIKNMVKQDAERIDKMSRRITELETVDNNIKLLAEMLQHYNSSASSDGEKDLMKELYENLEKERPKLFRLASDTDEKDTEGINQILNANDKVLKIMIEYKKIVEGVTEENGFGTLTSSPNKTGNSSLLDLELGAPSNPNPQSLSMESSKSLPDDQLLGGNKSNGDMTSTTSDTLDDLFSSPTIVNNNTNNTQNLLDGLLGGTTATPVSSLPGSAATVNPTPMAFPQVQPTPAIPPLNTSSPFSCPPSYSTTNNTSNFLTGILAPTGTPSSTSSTITPLPTSIPAPLGTAQQPTAVNTQQKSALDDLDKLGQSLLQQSLPLDQNKQSSFPAPTTTPAKIPMNQMPLGVAQSAAGVPLKTLAGANSATADDSPKKSVKAVDIQPLTDLFVPLESIKPGSVQPVTLYDKNDMKVVMHFAKDTPRPDVLVMVVSIMSNKDSPVTKCTYLAAVPKMMKVKLQPPSATDLPAFNPILPPTAITQVMLIANPHKEKIRLKFKLTYNTNDGPQSDVGEMDNFPVQ